MGASQPVPVGKEWGKVSCGPFVVSIMLGCTAPESEGHQVVQGPREVVAAVVFSGNVDVKDHKSPRCETVTLE